MQGIFNNVSIYKFLIRRFIALVAFSLLYVAIVVLVPADQDVKDDSGSYQDNRFQSVTGLRDGFHPLDGWDDGLKLDGFGPYFSSDDPSVIRRRMDRNWILAGQLHNGLRLQPDEVVLPFKASAKWTG